MIKTTFKLGSRITKGIFASALYGYGKRRAVWYYRLLLSEDFSYIITRYYKKHKVMRDVDVQYKRKEHSYENAQNNYQKSKPIRPADDYWNVQKAN